MIQEIILKGLPHSSCPACAQLPCRWAKGDIHRDIDIDIDVCVSAAYLEVEPAHLGAAGLVSVARLVALLESPPTAHHLGPPRLVLHTSEGRSVRLIVCGLVCSLGSMRPCSARPSYDERRASHQAGERVRCTDWRTWNSRRGRKRWLGLPA
jgi:hypothetical protein